MDSSHRSAYAMGSRICCGQAPEMKILQCSGLMKIIKRRYIAIYNIYVIINSTRFAVSPQILEQATTPAMPVHPNPTHAKHAIASSILGTADLCRGLQLEDPTTWNRRLQQTAPTPAVIFAASSSYVLQQKACK